jgi:hypothetical protein
MAEYFRRASPTKMYRRARANVQRGLSFDNRHGSERRALSATPNLGHAGHTLFFRPADRTPDSTPLAPGVRSRPWTALVITLTLRERSRSAYFCSHAARGSSGRPLRVHRVHRAQPPAPSESLHRCHGFWIRYPMTRECRTPRASARCALLVIPTPREAGGNGRRRPSGRLMS